MTCSNPNVRTCKPYFVVFCFMATQPVRQICGCQKQQRAKNKRWSPGAVNSPQKRQCLSLESWNPPALCPDVAICFSVLGFFLAHVLHQHDFQPMASSHHAGVMVSTRSGMLSLGITAMKHASHFRSHRGKQRGPQKNSQISIFGDSPLTVFFL